MIVERHKKWGILVASATAVVYGLYPPAVRAVYEAGANMPFVLTAAMFARTFSLTFFCMATGRKLYASRADGRIALSGGFFQALGVLGIFGALEYLPGPIVILIAFTHTLMLLFLMAWKNELRLTSLLLGTTLMALLGLSFVLNVWHVHNGLSVMGLALAFMSAVTTMSRLYIYGKQMKTRDPIVIGAETFIVGFLLICLYALFDAPQAPQMPNGYWWLLAACLSQAVGTFGMFYGIALLGSFEFSLISKVEPIFTALFSYVLIGEVLNMPQYGGIALVLGSLALYQYLDHKKKTA